MADIHGTPPESMMTPVQSFTSEPLPEVSALAQAAQQLSGPGGARQAQARDLLESPQGFASGGGTSGYDITSGWSGEPDESWANDVQMPSLLVTPIQGMGDYPGTC